MTWVAAGAAVLGTIVQMKGAKAAAEGSARASLFNEAVRRRNEKAANIQADFRILLAKIEAGAAAERFRELQSGVTVAYAKGGVTPGTGSARLVAEKNAEEFDEQQAADMMAAEAGAQEWREKGVNERLEGDLQRIYAQNYITAGKYQMRAAFVGGISKTASLLSGSMSGP
jgi:hypothetical protein